VQAAQALDMSAFNFFEITSNATAVHFFDDINLKFKGEVYSDIGEVLWTFGGQNLKSTFGGVDAVVDSSGIPVSGTTQAFWQSAKLRRTSFRRCSASRTSPFRRPRCPLPSRRPTRRTTWPSCRRRWRATT